MRKTKMTIITVTALCLTATITAVTANALLKSISLTKESEQSVNQLEQYIANNTKSGYTALTEIKMGDTISESMLQWTTTMVSDVDQSMFIDASDLGKVATTTIAAGVPVYKSMVSEYAADSLRERECSFIWLSTNLKDFDFVDVRILFPNGEDYIVAAKKAIYDTRIQVNDVYLRLTEEEIQLLDSAIVDANMHNAKIYVTKYTAPEIQEASMVTYSPNSDVMRVIANDANIVERSATALSVDARSAMDKRLSLFEEAYPGFILEEDVGSNTRYDASFFEAESEVQ